MVTGRRTRDDGGAFRTLINHDTMTRTLSTLLLLCVMSTLASAQTQTFPVTLEHLGSDVNSGGNDYAPFVTASQDTLYFTSSRGGRSSGRADIYATTRLDNGWTPAMTSGAVNTKRNDGALSIAADGRTIVFASDAYDGAGDADLYIGELVGGAVVNVRNLGERVNTGRWESQPAISGDGRTLYFASNRPGGQGRSDLWMSHRDAAGEWSIPVNLGPVVNSAEDELSPFVTRDGGTLFFSTSGRGGLGGHDVVMSAVLDGGFGLPVNLGSTVNSAADDLFFSAPAASERFYLASTRAGGAGGLDIYAGSPNVFGDGMFPSGDSTAKVLASYDMGSYDVPFFVTGYYRPNTTRNLEELVGMRAGELRGADYIERFPRGSARFREYAGYARQVEEIFATATGPATRKHFTDLAADGTTDIIEIAVTGYADPQDFSGSYVETTMVDFNDADGNLITLRRGSPIGNLELSGLRAWHSARHIDALLDDGEETGAGAYVALRSQGRIRFRIIAGGVHDDGGALELQRRINVTIVRTPAETPRVTGVVAPAR